MFRMRQRNLVITFQASSSLSLRSTALHAPFLLPASYPSLPPSEPHCLKMRLFSLVSSSSSWLSFLSISSFPSKMPLPLPSPRLLHPPPPPLVRYTKILMCQEVRFHCSLWHFHLTTLPPPYLSISFSSTGSGMMGFCRKGVLMEPWPSLHYLWTTTVTHTHTCTPIQL